MMALQDTVTEQRHVTDIAQDALGRMLRRWWSGYWLAPLGTVALFVLLAVIDLATLPRPFTSSDAQEIVEAALVGVAVSYLVGLALLPAFVVFELSRWTGWIAYLPTGAVTGALTGWVITYPSPVHATLHGFSALAGVLCALVFSARVGIDGGIRQTAQIVSLPPRL